MDLGTIGILISALAFMGSLSYGAYQILSIKN